MLLIVVPFTNIDRTIRISKFSKAMLLSILIFTYVFATISPDMSTFPMHLSFFPVSLVLSAI
jgi:hypothetical protein